MPVCLTSAMAPGVNEVTLNLFCCTFLFFSNVLHEEAVQCLPFWGLGLWHAQHFVFLDIEPSLCGTNPHSYCAFKGRPNPPQPGTTQVSSHPLGAPRRMPWLVPSLL